EHAPRWRAYILGNIAWVLALEGDRDEALAACERALAAGRESADPSVSSFALWAAAYTLGELGELEQARARVRQALAEPATPPHRIGTQCVEAALDCREAATAAQGTQRLEARLAELWHSRFVPAHGLFAIALAEGYVKMGALERGRRSFEEVLALAER